MQTGWCLHCELVFRKTAGLYHVALPKRSFIKDLRKVLEKLIFFTLATSQRFVRKVTEKPVLDILHHRCSWRFCKIHRTAPVLESLFNKVSGRQTCNFLKKRLQHRCFPVNFAKFLRTLFYRTLSYNCFCSNPVDSIKQ